MTTLCQRLLATALLVTLCVAARADIAPSVINGDPTADYPSVGIVASDDFPDGFCTGTLIGPNKVLTAAHCTWGSTADELSFLINDTAYPVAEIYIHPSFSWYDFGTDRAYDISVLILSTDVDGITPSPIYRQRPLPGTPLTLVGYGAGGTGSPDGGLELDDFGTKRVGTTTLERVGRTILYWFFDSNNESNTAHGDSGGPSFIEQADTLYVAGITTGGDSDPSRLGGISYNTRVDSLAAWIDNPANGPTVVVYRLVKSLVTVTAEGRQRDLSRGYLVADPITQQVYEIELRREGRQWTVEPPCELQASADRVFLASLQTDRRPYAAFSLLDTADESATLIDLLGPAGPLVYGFPVLRAGRGDLLHIDTTGSFSEGAYILRYSLSDNRLLTAADTAEAIANQLHAELVDRYGAAISHEPASSLPATQAVEDDTIIVHRVYGSDLFYGAGFADRLPLRGYLVLQASTDTATIIAAAGSGSDGFISTLPLQNQADIYQLELQAPGLDYQLLAGYTPLSGGLEAIHLQGRSRPGQAPRAYQGAWLTTGVTDFDSVFIKQLFRTRYDYRETQAAEGQTVATIVAQLRLDLRQRLNID